MTFDIQWEEDFSDEDEPISPIYVNIFDFLDNITFSSVVEGFEQELTVPAEISNLIWNFNWYQSG